MAATYDKLPILASNIFEDIVSTVSTNLASDGQLNIPQVAYYCETWKELCARLDIEGKDEGKKDVRFPLVAVIRNFALKHEAQDRFSGKFTIVIAATSNASWDSEKRELVNFIPVLNPIYSELLSVMEDSTHVLNHGYLSHNADDNLHLGTGSDEGNLKYRLPEVVDAKVIEIELTLTGDRDLRIRHGNALTLSYVNNVASLDCSIGTKTLTVRPLHWLYTNTLNGATATRTYYFSHNPSGTWSTPAINTPYTVNFESQTGDYYGYISSNDGTTESKLYFYYTLKDGQVTKYTTLTTFNLGLINTSNITYPYYPVTATLSNESSVSNISMVSISYGGGNAYQDYPFIPNTAITGETDCVLALEKPSGIMDIGMTVVLQLLDNTTQLESISFYKLT